LRGAAPTDPNRDADDLPTNFFKPRFDGGPNETMDPEATSTGVSEPAGAGRSVLMALGGLIAMAIGAFGGAMIYRSIQDGAAPTVKSTGPAPGVGRVSISSDRPAEVQLGGQLLGKTPVVDVYLPSGTTVLRLREPNGPWREAVLNVKKDQMNKFEVKLDTLPVAP
jgi:hypothetical protein